MTTWMMTAQSCLGKKQDSLKDGEVGYGGIDYWHDGRTAFDNINVCFEYGLEIRERLIIDGHINWHIYTEHSGGLMTNAQAYRGTGRTAHGCAQ